MVYVAWVGVRSDNYSIHVHVHVAHVARGRQTIKLLSNFIVYFITLQTFQYDFDADPFQVCDTGWSNWTEISFDLITPARRHPMKWDRSPFSPDIRTFWYIVSKNSNRFYIIFTDLCVGGLVFWIFVKIHWILRIQQTSVLFCKYLRDKSSDLHEIFCGRHLVSCEL